MEFDFILHKSNIYGQIFFCLFISLSFFPPFFRKVIDANQREAWVTNETYWELRKDPGFSKVDIPVLW